MSVAAQRPIPSFSRAALWGSKADDWETPERFFRILDREFHFTLDAAASHENAKCSSYYTVENDGLAQDWGTETVWLNPPYGKEISQWIRKAWEATRMGATVVCLIPARTDTAWWHGYVMRSDEVRLVEGRIHFGGSASGAPFPSAVVVFRPFGHGASGPLVRSWPR